LYYDKATMVTAAGEFDAGLINGGFNWNHLDVLVAGHASQYRVWYVGVSNP
jgi:hypothetical protein